MNHRSARALGARLIAVAGAAMVAYGILFLVRNFTGFTELGLTPELCGGTPQEIRAFSPRLYNYISHLHIAVGGLIIGLGMATVALGWFGVRAGDRWALWAALAAPATALAIVLPIHHVYGLATLGHIGPAYLAALLLLAGIVLASMSDRAPTPISNSGSDPDLGLK